MKRLKTVNAVRELSDAKVLTKLGLKYIRGGNSSSGADGNGRDGDFTFNPRWDIGPTI